ncbi:12809_t:CDS:2 [Cetraspora pellucida]|uniref:12809_t:CDS:1 n=1 Tax=Cetraspora pellucida TaxID=1433469 RepID=A0A9N9EKR4_9GLOM|nr:12809_t:CDS:2 [Cetraspora pellucida]
MNKALNNAKMYIFFEPILKFLQITNRFTANYASLQIKLIKEALALEVEPYSIHNDNKVRKLTEFLVY